ncbi:MAG: glycolate oxidase subunit GlcE [Alphaproteobacteria bacterium]|jgi:glycolate oxidase FAD binding subunit|nr:glycolate oxidase subunit GlcE [Alphaproteobacteria bacterium]MDP6516386.1 glycolate oxidase subunit GlcE [Alphaproteobacteria bacterium]
MASRWRPDDAEQARAAVAWAVAEETPIEIVGAATKRALGRPTNADITLDLSALRGITYYEPAELALSAAAGTPLAEIEAALGEHHQQLAFEPPDLGPLLGAPARAGTLGGVLAGNLSGPRRFKAGAARDHFLGLSAINGRGEAYKSGGRVVKNVTGYDLCKLLAGSFGTLGVLTEVTVKVLPAPEKIRTVLVHGLDDDEAVRLMSSVSSGPQEASALAHLPAPVAARSAVGHVGGAGAAVTAARIEGPAPSVLFRCAQLRERFGSHGAVEELHGKNSIALWREIANVAPILAPARRAVWRLSVPPAAAPGVVTDIVSARPADWYFDWAGGLIWLTCAQNDGGGHAEVRAAIAASGGHATLISADADLRGAVPVFQPQAEALSRLSVRVKESFDPRRIFNRGRMYPGL